MRRPPRDPKPQAIDDQTGFKVDLDKLRKQWDGMLTVDPDRRNPQDHLKGIRDDPSLPYSRPEPDDVFATDYIALEDGTPILLESVGIESVNLIYTESSVSPGSGL